MIELAGMTTAHAVNALTRALRLRPDSEIMDWMQRPDLWIEFIDVEGTPLVMVGLLRPDWLRWNPYGDVRLTEPVFAEDLLTSFGLDDVTS